MAAVAIEFPQGLYGKLIVKSVSVTSEQSNWIVNNIVGLVYTILLGASCILLITLNRQGLEKGGIFTMGSRIVLQYYLGKFWETKHLLVRGATNMQFSLLHCRSEHSWINYNHWMVGKVRVPKPSSCWYRLT